MQLRFSRLAQRNTGGHVRRQFRAVGLSLACIVWAFAPVRADDKTDEATVYLADGGRVTAIVRSLSSGELVLARQPAERLATSDVVRLEFPNRAVHSPRASLIQLANGDRIVAGLSSMNDEALVALWKAYPDLPPVQIPVAAIAGILVSLPENAVDKTRTFSQVFGRREKSDSVLLVNGDRLAGELKSFDQSALKLSQGGKVVEIELPRVRGMTFSSELSSLPAPRGPRIAVTLTDGSQLTGWNASCEGGGPLRFSSVLASSLELPLSAVAGIRFLDGRATYLSDLQPTESRLAPYFGSVSQVRPAVDHNAAGGPLIIRGRHYGKGLGTRSGSRIAYQLGAQFRSFQATAALDDLSERKGNVRFAVELDGVRVWTSALITGGSRPLAVGPIDVTGKRQLVLIVEYGELADVDDWADWCDAIVIR
jgi:sRNA-binding regulator protein Hfq